MFKQLVSHHAEGKTNLVEYDHFGNTKGLGLGICFMLSSFMIKFVTLVLAP